MIIYLQYQRLKSNLLEILNKPYEKINKVYSLLPISKVEKIDNRTVSWLQSNGKGFSQKSNKQLAPVIESRIDCEINSWLKYFLNYIVKLLQESIRAFLASESYYRDELHIINKFWKTQNEMQKKIKQSQIFSMEKALKDVCFYINSAKKMIFEINSAICSSQLNDIGYPSISIPPLAISKNYKYRYFYKLHCNLKKILM